MILPSTQYTALNPQTLEVIPSRQMRGLPVRVCWAPPRDEAKLDPNDRLEFFNQKTDKVAFQLTGAVGKGAWDGASLQWPDLDTSNLDPGEYVVRIVGDRNKRKDADAAFC